MKVLLVSLIVLMCSCVTAVAQTTSTRVGSASVTSTIRVRIPDFASVVLKENKTVADSQADPRMNSLQARSSEPLELQAPKKWILHIERRSNSREQAFQNARGPSKAEVVHLVHTSSPE